MTESSKERTNRLLSMSHGQLILYCQDIEKQCDELLAALDQIVNGVMLKDGMNHDDNGLNELANRAGDPYIWDQLRKLDGIARAAIANMKGGAA